MTRKLQIFFLLSLALLFQRPAFCQEEKKNDAARLISQLADEEATLREIPFAEVLMAATGKKLIPLNLKSDADRELLAKISKAMDAVLAKINAPDFPGQKERRINEFSAFVEHEMIEALNAVPGFSCGRPLTATGKTQLSGYPDIRLVDKTTGRVIYLDPKLYERGSRNSSLRTFYFEPKKGSNKVLDDAHHILVGFEHDGRADEKQWKFLAWDLVDLAHFKVRLKAEFQGSNKDLYREESVVGSSRK